MPVSGTENCTLRGRYSVEFRRTWGAAEEGLYKRIAVTTMLSQPHGRGGGCDKHVRWNILECPRFKTAWKSLLAAWKISTELGRYALHLQVPGLASAVRHGCQNGNIEPGDYRSSFFCFPVISVLFEQCGGDFFSVCLY